MIVLRAFSTRGLRVETFSPASVLVAIPVLIIMLVPLLWMGGASIFVIAGAGNGVRDALGKAWPKIGSFGWLSLVSGFMIMGGYLLLFIPGVIFTIWFLFAPFILALDDRRGMSALLNSKAFVRGDLPAVFLRYLVPWLISAVLGFIPLAGPFLSLAFMPFLLIFTFELYRDLREMKGDVRFADSIGEKCKWLGAGAFGYVLVPIIAMTFMGSILFSLIPYAKSFLRAGTAATASSTGKSLQLPSTPFMESLFPAESDPDPVEVSAAEYEALLAKEQIAYEPGKGLSVGPAALLLDQEKPAGKHQVFFDGKMLFEVEDETFKDAGQTGLWTKADSVTYFDDVKITVLDAK